MAFIRIEGQRVRVDDSFLTKTLDEQCKEVEEIGQALGIEPGARRKQEERQQAPTAKEGEGEGDGVALNATAGLNQSIYNTLGAPVDFSRWLINKGIEGANAATGSEMSTIPTDSFGGSDSISRMFGAVGVPEPKDVRASSPEERIARGVGEGVGYTVGPSAVVGGAARTGALTGRVLDGAQRLFGSGASTGRFAADSFVGGASGAGASAAMEATPDRYDTLSGLAGGLAGGGAGALVAGIPAMVRAGGQMARDFAAPLFQEGREQIAGRQILDSATDPYALRQALEEPAQDLVAGSQPTTFQATGDMGIGGLERGIQTKRPEAFQQRRVDQNSARLSALEGVQPEGSPIKVADTARQLVSAVTSRAQAAYDDVVAGARRSAEEAAARGQRTVDDAAGRVGLLTQTMGDGTGARASGEGMRSTLEEARAAAKSTERALWQAVDPDGSLALSAGNTRQQANDLLSSMPKSAKPPTGEEAAILQAVGGFDQTVPFSELTALQSRIKAEMRAERMTNGESPAWRRLSILSRASDADIETAVAGKMQQEAQAVARGEMAEADTILANMQRQQRDWYEQRSQTQGMGQSAANAVGADAFGGSGRISAVPGTAQQGGRQFRDTSGNPGVQETGLLPNFDPGARDRLTAARTATRERVETFDNKTLGPMRRRPSYAAPYDMAAESVPAKVFYGRPESARAIDQYRAAVGQEAADQQIQQYAVSRLRQAALNADGSVSPAKLETWRRSHAEALEKLPALRQQVDELANSARSLAENTRAADRMGRDAGRAADAEISAAARQHRLMTDAAQRSRLGKVMNADSGEAVVKQVGSVFGRSDSAREMLKLNLAARSDPEAANGLRRAVVDHILDRFVSNTEAGTSGQSLIKGDQFQTFMKQNKPTLRAAGFNDAEIGNMQAIADDIRRANRSLSAVRIPGQSNTAQDAYAAAKTDAAGSILSRLVSAVGKGGSITAAVGGRLASALREQGFEGVDDIVADALLNPGRARLLLAKTTPKSEQGTARMLADLYARSVPATGMVVSGQENTGKRGSSGNRTHDWIEARIRSFGGMSGQGVAESMKKLADAKPGVAGQIMRELIRVEKLDLGKADKAPAIRYILESALGESPDAEPKAWRGQRFGPVDKEPLEITIPVPIR